MVVVLDTNHFTEFVDASPSGLRLMAHTEERKADVFTCVVAAEETVQVWLALLHRQRAGRDQLVTYTKFKLGLETLLRFTILPFDEEAADTFDKLRRDLPRLGSMDLKIASICMAQGATLLTRNLVDFDKVPGLRVENWLD